MRCARRASLPDFRAALRVHLVETSPVLRAQQHSASQAAPRADRLARRARRSVPTGPRSSSPTSSSTRCRCASSCEPRRAGASAWSALTRTAPGLRPLRRAGPAASRPPRRPRRGLRSGRQRRATVDCDAGEPASPAGRRGARHRLRPRQAPAFGDTLQAVRRHAFADPLAEPGEADLTAHVDFAALAEAARAAGARPCTARRRRATSSSARHRTTRRGAEARARRRRRAADIDAAARSA